MSQHGRNFVKKNTLQPMLLFAPATCKHGTNPCHFLRIFNPNFQNLRAPCNISGPEARTEFA